MDLGILPLAIWTDFGNIVATIMGVFGLASVAGLGLVKGVITNLRDSVDDADKTIARVKAELADLESENVELRADRLALQRMVTGESHWSNLVRLLTDHNDEARGHWSNDEELLGSLQTAMENTAHALRRLVDTLESDNA